MFLVNEKIHVWPSVPKPEKGKGWHEVPHLVNDTIYIIHFFDTGIHARLDVYVQT